MGLSPSFTFDQGKCTLLVSINWHFIGGDGPAWVAEFVWDAQKEKQWKEKAKKVVEEYFSGLKLKCASKDPKHCSCPDGVKVKVEVNWTSDGDAVYVDRTFGRSKTRDHNMYLLYLDINEYHNEGTDGKEYAQTIILHEVGHSFGLNHPGGPNDSDAAYNADPGSLMGLGNELRNSDFEKAFCSKMPGGGYPDAK